MIELISGSIKVEFHDKFANINRNIMIILQMLQEVPEWARERGLDEKSFDILERIAGEPSKQDEILRHEEYGTACCIIEALEYAKDKGIIEL